MKKSSADRGRRRSLVVVASCGQRLRFLRGMITHDLMQRGLSFDDAYAAAHALRDRLSDRDEVTTAELREMVQEQLEKQLGDAAPPPPPSGLPEIRELEVVSNGRTQPFSRGVLARSLFAAGLDLDRAYRLILELEEELRQDSVLSLSSKELARRMSDLLERQEGAGAARRYRLVRRIHRLPNPLVIYIGGASGTGKSTLALELAPLLRIYRIISTDTIRQVMRMVFSPAILPALHTSSFETVPMFGTTVVEEAASRLGEETTDPQLATLEEQATRVCVGVRAVVERAIAEHMSLVVEGVHLLPPLIPFGDLEGATYQVPLLLATLDAETHRSRFLGRSRLGRRRTERYLESFDSIRSVHEHLLQQAETHDIPLIDTGGRGEPALRAMRLIMGLLQKRVPRLSTAAWSGVERGVPTLLLIVDGLADRPVRALGNRTPLQAAETPTLDRLAREGQCGLADPISPGVVPDTAAGSLALFGQSPLAMKRGPVEALGAGCKLGPNDIALRGNLATLDDEGRVIDRRAGRIREETVKLAKSLDGMVLEDGDHKVRIEVRPATEHRLAIVLRGKGLVSQIQTSDPGDGAAPGPPLPPQPLDPNDERAVYTARMLALFEQEARATLEDHPVNRRRRKRGDLPANCVLTRGAGRVHQLVPLEEAGIPLRLSCISGDQTILGLARWLGADILSDERMTANLDTDLEHKLEQARSGLTRKDLVILHVKGADIAAHDQRPELKAEFISRVDQELGRLLDSWNGALRVAVAGDHATLSESGQHAADPLPVLIWGEGLEADTTETYDELAVATGRLQRFPLQLLLGKLFQLE